MYGFILLYRVEPIPFVGYKLCTLHYGIYLSRKTHRHVIRTSYKPLESAIYIGNDYATRHPRRSQTRIIEYIGRTRVLSVHANASLMQ